MKKRHLVMLFGAVLLSLLLFSIDATPSDQNQAQPDIAHAQAEDACVEQVRRAFSDTGLYCADLNGGSACYGAGQAEAILAQVSDAAFNLPGDTVALNTVVKLANKPVTNEYGVVVVDLEANRDVLSPSNVIMLLLGEASIEQFQPAQDNTPSSLRLHTAEPTSDCLTAPPSSLVLQSVPGSTFDIVINGTHIRAGSTIFVRITAQNTLRVAVGQGEATLFPLSATSLVIPAGYQADVPLDEEGNALGTWTNWQVGAEEIVRFEALERMPSNILNGPYNGPSFFQGSGVGAPPPVIQPPPDDVPPVPVPFPVIDPRPRAGTDLPVDVAYETIEVGAPTCPTDENVIIFHGDATGNWDIYSLAPDVNNVSNGPGHDIQPTYSQDYRWVAFTSNRVDEDNWELYAAQLDGENLQRITFNTARDINPAWGPDGQLIFESDRSGNWELYLVDLLVSRELTRLTDHEANDVNVFWTPDGTAIYFQSDRDGDYEIYHLDLTTEELTQITDNNVADAFPVVSNDGNFLAWVQNNDAGYLNLWIRDLTTDETRRLTDVNRNIWGHVFAPDDSFLAFYANLDGDFDVYALSLEETDDNGDPLIKNLTDDQDDDENDGDDDRAPAFRCDSPIVVFHSDRVNRQADLYQVNPMGFTDGYRDPARITATDEDFEIFPVSDSRDEFNSRLNSIPEQSGLR